MTGWRRYEKRLGEVVEYWEIRHEGIRCFIAWGREGGRRRASTTTLEDQVQAERHLARKIREKLRKGYLEVNPGPAADGTDAEQAEQAEQADAKLFDLRGGSGGYLPVDGRDEVYHSRYSTAAAGPFGEYLLLRDQGRRAVRFVVKDPDAWTEPAAAFLDFLDTRRDLPSDGRSHHKVALPMPLGRFTHALFCSPALGWSVVPGRIATAFPIFDCEIGDADTEVLVEARIKGRDCLPHSTWDREPWPVIDLRFDLRAAGAEPFTRFHRAYLRGVKNFKVYSRRSLEPLMQTLAEATPDSYLEIRSFRGERKVLRPRDLTADVAVEIDRLLLGRAAL